MKVTYASLTTRKHSKDKRKGRTVLIKHLTRTDAGNNAGTPSALDGCEWSVAALNRCTSGIHWTTRRFCPTAYPQTVAKTKILAPIGNQTQIL